MKPKAQDNDSKLKFNYLIGVLLLGFIFGWLCKWSTTRTILQPTVVRENSPAYNFINPILYTITDKKLYPEYEPLRKEISSYIASSTKNSATGASADSVSVYFQDMNTSKWTGVNEDINYNPGSMLKVAVLIGYLRRAELDPSIFSKKLYYTATLDPGQTYKPEHPLATGYYTVQQLVDSMIIQSDNEATKELVTNDDADYVTVENELKLPKATDDPEKSDFMSPKEYSSLFRILYNSTYLNRDLSDQVLHLLSQADFKDGLVNGVPTGTVVAHKFGEHSEENNSVILYRELHDCGIVYFPEKPYFLCVMTKGHDFNKLSPVISGISKLVYQYVNSTAPAISATTTSTSAK